MQLFNVLNTRREVEVLDCGTPEDNFLGFVQIEDELFCNFLPFLDCGSFCFRVLVVFIRFIV